VVGNGCLCTSSVLLGLRPQEGPLLGAPWDFGPRSALRRRGLSSPCELAHKVLHGEFLQGKMKTDGKNTTKGNKKRKKFKTRPTARPLVGVEPNPGPKPGKVKRVLQKVFPPGMFKAAGAWTGGALGGPAGAVLGGAAGSILSRITGVGDYKIVGNTLWPGSSGKQDMPVFSNAADGFIISHREFVTDIAGSVAFANKSFLINPANASLFPWLSTVAVDFEQYEMLGMVVEYRPTSGAIGAATPNLGTVVFATDYNCINPVFNSKMEMEAYEYCTSTVSNTGMIHPIECKRADRPNRVYYTSTFSVSAGTIDPLMLNLGNLQVGTVGQQGTYPIGEMWVSYHIRLLKPRLNPLGNELYWTGSGAGPCTAASDRLGGLVANTVTPYSCTLPGITTGTNKIIIQRQGYYLLTVIWGSTANVAAAPTVSLGASLFDGVGFVTGTAYYENYSGSNAILYYSLGCSGVSALIADNTVTFGGLTGMTAGVCQVFISRWMGGRFGSREMPDVPGDYIMRPIPARDEDEYVPVQKDASSTICVPVRRLK